jgi:ABC-2 type transport system permease protein
MNPVITLATARRVLRQLGHDPRTLAMLALVPALLMVLLRYIFSDQLRFDHVAPILLGLFPFTIMFLVTSVATLRERRSGTLERLMTMPAAKLDFLLGYGIAFGLVALAQVGIVTLVTETWLGLTIAGSLWSLVLVALLSAVLGTGLGLCVSAFARTEFQAVQFMPLLVLPQVLLCGLFVPRGEMARWLQLISNAFPLSYTVEAMQDATGHATLSAAAIRDLIVIAGCVVLSLVLGAITLRRRTA